MALDWYSPLSERKGYKMGIIDNCKNWTKSAIGKIVIIAISGGIISIALPTIIAVILFRITHNPDLVGASSIIDSVAASPNVAIPMQRVKQYCYPDPWTKLVSGYDDQTCKYWLSRASEIDWPQMIANAQMAEGTKIIKKKAEEALPQGDYTNVTGENLN